MIVVFSVRPPKLDGKGDQIIWGSRLSGWKSAADSIVFVCRASPYFGLRSTLFQDPVDEKLYYFRISFLRWFWRFIVAMSCGFSLQRSIYFFPILKVQSLRPSLFARCDKLVFNTIRSVDFHDSIDSLKANRSFAVLIELIDALSKNFASMVNRATVLDLACRFESARLFCDEISTSAKYKSVLVSADDKKYLLSRCISSTMSRSLRSSVDSNIRVIPNGVYLPDEAYDYSVWNNRDSDIFIGFIGNLDYHPNTQAILALLLHILPILPSYFRVRIAGPISSRLKSSLLSKMQPELRQRVEFLGFVSCKFQFFNECHFSVMPFVSGSGLQNKVLEVLGFGLPTLLSDYLMPTLPGFPPLFHSDASQPSVFASELICMSRLSVCDLQRMTLPVSDHVRINYNWNNNLKQFFDI